VNWQDLKDHFKQCGQVLRADVLEGSDGRSKGCGLVEFKDRRDAARALETLHDTELRGRKIFVREDREAPGGGRSAPAAASSRSVVSSHAAAGSYAAAPTRLYVGNLSWEVTWQDLKDCFKRCGHVIRADIPSEEGTGRSKGYGLVDFADSRDAARAIRDLNETEFMGRNILVREDREGGGAYPSAASRGAHRSGGGSTRLYVGNLSYGVTWKELKDHFKSIGHVLRADVLEGSDGRSKGCGLVEYSNAGDAAHAIRTLHDSNLMGRLIFVREDREA